MKKGHTLLKGTSKFGISERMRGLLCLVGQSVVYEEACELFDEMMGLEISTPQVQRVCSYYGNAIDPLVNANCEPVIPALEVGKQEDKVYVMVDGSMIYIRDEGWRELKLGRLFHQSQVFNIQAKRRQIMDSVYVSHLGSVEEFFPKFERYLVG